MVLKSTSQGVSDKYSKWTSEKSRGGLQHPNDNSFLLVREMENIMRKEVDQENLNADSFLKDKHIETIMPSFMFKYYCEKLFQPVTSHYEGGKSLPES